MWPWSDPFETLSNDLKRSLGLTEAMADSVARLVSWCKHYGISFQITSGRRSPEKQAALYQAYLRGQNPYPVAKPGSSDHETGNAIDAVFPLQRWQDVEYLGAQAGLRWGGRFSRPDYVHFYR